MGMGFWYIIFHFSVFNGIFCKVGSPPIKLNWRTPLNDLMFSKFVEFEHTSVGGILGCVASTLALV